MSDVKVKEPTQKTIGEHSFEFRNWNPEHGLRMLTRLIKICGEPAARAIITIGETAQQSEKGLDAEVDNAAKMKMASAAISSLAMNLDEDNVVQFVNDCFQEAYWKGKPLASVKDVVFVGRPGLQLKVVQAQLQHQLSDFLELLPVSGLS